MHVSSLHVVPFMCIVEVRVLRMYIVYLQYVNVQLSINSLNSIGSDKVSVLIDILNFG